MAADQVVKPMQKDAEGQTESGTTRKEPISCRVVVITVRSKSGLKGLVAPPPLKGVKSENHCLVGDKKTLEDAFRKVEEGDILVVNAHANEDYFIYGRSKNPVYWTGDTENPGAWEFLGIKKPPKLAALVIASCMKASDEEAVSSGSMTGYAYLSAATERTIRMAVTAVLDRIGDGRESKYVQDGSDGHMPCAPLEARASHPPDIKRQGKKQVVSHSGSPRLRSRLHHGGTHEQYHPGFIHLGRRNDLAGAAMARADQHHEEQGVADAKRQGGGHPGQCRKLGVCRG